MSVVSVGNSKKRRLLNLI